MRRIFINSVLLCWAVSLLITSPGTTAWAKGTAEPSAPSKPGPGTTMAEYTTRAYGHTGKIRVSIKPFDRAKAGLAADAPLTPELRAQLEARYLGIDYDLPEYEFAQFIVWFDGKELTIPTQWYTDCANPKIGGRNFWTQLGDEGESLFVFMSGSDAAGHYDVMWTLRKDGHHARLTSDVSDMAMWNREVLKAGDGFGKFPVRK